MIIERIEEEWKFKGSGLGRSDATETGKIHLSDIAKYIDLKMQFTKRPKASFTWNLPAAGELGFVWENVLSLALGDRYAARLSEIELDGIVGSPDGLSPNDPKGLVPLVNEEYKLTWKSAWSKPEDNWYWMTQFKSYCHMLGVTVTILRVLYINGDYKGNRPLPEVYRIEYSPRDLQENWDMICNHRDEMLKLGYMNVQEAIKGMQEEL